MKKINIAVFLLLLSISFVSCKKDDDGKVEPPRDRGVQYLEDIDNIETYLQTHYMVVDADFNVEIFEIPEGGTQISIWDQTEYPLQYDMVKNDSRTTFFVDGRIDDDVDYKLYYVIFNQGGGQRPTTIDSTYATYRGWKLDNQQFDISPNPIWFTFEGIEVSGFRQFTAKLNAAENFTMNNDGTATFNNFGAGVVFIPSGLGYFERTAGGIGAYQPLVFNIKLMGLRYRDHDRDGILSKDEMYNDVTDPFLQDTDGDNVPDFLDVDDDGDGRRTIDEIKDSEGNIIPFDLIPDCNGNTTNPERLKKHLDPSCW